MFLIVASAIAWALAPRAAGEGLAEVGFRTALNTVALSVLAHFLLLPVPQVVATLRILRHSLDRSILAEPPESGSMP
jgi:hypothetical protein